MKLKFIAIFSASTLAFAVALKADQAVPLPVEQLTAQSQLILQGTVASKTVQRDSEGRIYTKIELAVTEVWKGNLSTNRFTVVQGGGVLGEDQTAVSGQSQYEVGEEVVAFVRLNQRGEGVTIGLAQGKFRVWTDSSTGEKHANNPFHGSAQTASVGPAQANVQPSSPQKTRLSVSTLKQRVQGGGQ